MILGSGIDIISVARVEKLLDSGGPRFLARWFDPAEIEYCQGKAKPCLHYAARLAAKEAAVKALGLAWEGPLAWRDIRVTTAEEARAPSLILKGTVRAAAEGLGVHRLYLSLSHCDEYATASVIAEGGAPADPGAQEKIRS